MFRRFGSGCSPAVSLTSALVALFIVAVLVAVPFASAQTTGQMSLMNNYFVTGDYVVGGVGLRGLGDSTGYATGTINIPDKSQPNWTQIPQGADIVAAWLYWETVESSQTANAGQNGFFRGYPIHGTELGNPNAPVSWSSGGCSGASSGSKTMRTYRTDVRRYLPIDPNTGKIVNSGNGSYTVRLADSGSNGGGAPLTLGATLVIIYRVLDKTAPAAWAHYPLNAIILYDGAFAPANGSTTMTLPMQGFYEPAQSGAVAKLTHIVGNGQKNKYEQVFFHGQGLQSPYGKNAPAFPGIYNGSWDNPTWDVSPLMNSADTSETTKVVPNTTNSGCVSWGAVVFSTTVQSSDSDGLVDVWKQQKGYCDAAVNSGVCTLGSNSDPGYVALPDAHYPGQGQQDLYIQVDGLCDSAVVGGVCQGTSYLPDMSNTGPLASVATAFANHAINVHYSSGPLISRPGCQDNTSVSPPQYCSFPGVPAVLGWKAGFEYLKNRPTNYPDETSCEQALNGPCIRQFQHGKKDSYHYALFGNLLARPTWSLKDGSLVSVTGDNTGTNAIFTTQNPHNLASGNRVTVMDAISNPNMFGVYFVTVIDATHFSIPVAAPPATYPQYPYTASTDPHLSVTTVNLTSASGTSDIGGADSAITLGGWGADATPNVIAGTFMHEVGHTLALKHGGYYFDSNTANNYSATVEANCKSNYLSVMNYLFQVDLLGADGGLDYSNHFLATLNEGSLGTGISVNSPLPFGEDGTTGYSTTRWYDSTPPGGVGTPAKRFCDGRKVPTDANGNPTISMYLLEGPEPPPANVTSSVTVPWSSQSMDVDFNNVAGESLRGFNDWNTIDLRQIGATGSTIAGSGILGDGGGILGDGGGILGDGGGILGDGGGILGDGGGILGDGGGILGDGGGIQGGEITHEVANAVVRPPRNLTATPTDTRLLHQVQLNWMIPSFGQIDSYNVYRNDVNGVFFNVKPAATTYTDSNPPDATLQNCTTYTYFVSALLQITLQQSVGSNQVTYTVPCVPAALAFSNNPVVTPQTNTTGSIALNWPAASGASGPISGYNVYRAVGPSNPQPGDFKLLAAATNVPTTNFTDTTVQNSPYPGTYYTYLVTTVLQDHGRESSGSTSVQTMVFWKKLQTIQFGALPTKTYGDADFQISATSVDHDTLAVTNFQVNFSSTAKCTVSASTLNNDGSSTATVHIVGAGQCTITATAAGNATYQDATPVPQVLTIAKANPIITGPTGYSVTYDGNPHTATATIQGVFPQDNLTPGLDLSGTVHTNAGVYNDSWAYNDQTGNYNNVNGFVADSIAKANPTIIVNPYSVQYDGLPHTATGSATGVKGEALAGLNLSGTTHTNAGTYANDPWAFTDTTGNYNNAGGTVTDVILQGSSVTTITSIVPSPSTLGQAYTVYVKVTAAPGYFGTPGGTVIVSDVTGASCRIDALSGGAGSCQITPGLFVTNTVQTAVGNVTVTASYGGDINFTPSNGNAKHQVVYNFNGFLTPLKLSAYSGSFNYGKTVPIKWQLTSSSGTFITMNNLNLQNVTLVADFNGQPVNGTCPGPTLSTVNLVLYTGATGAAAGNSTFRYDSTNNQFIFNWDTTSATQGNGCYTIILRLDDAVLNGNGVYSPLRTTSLQLK